MNIGDRVRLLHGKEEGIVIGVKNNIIEIEIEDGFVIPASRNEVVLVAKEEGKLFEKSVEPSKKEEKRTSIFAEHGIFLAVIPISQSTFELHLINNTDYTISLNLFIDQKNKLKGLHPSLLKPKTSEYIKNILSSEDDLPEMVIQGLYFTEYLNKIKDAILKRIKIKTFIIAGNQTKAPLIAKNGFLIQIDGEQVSINSKKLKESIEENKARPQTTFNPISPGKEIDLHIEKLTSNSQNLSNSEMLKLQLNAFESALDMAIAAGQDEIKIIHGIGNGVLRNEIQKRLSKMKNIKFFEDSMKERFGFGATLVKIK